MIQFDSTVYIGKTIRSVDERVEEHFDDDMVELKNKKYSIITLGSTLFYEDKYNFTGDELDRLETFYIHKYFHLGYNLINKNKVPKEQPRLIGYPQLDTGVINDITIKLNIDSEKKTINSKYKGKLILTRFSKCCYHMAKQKHIEKLTSVIV